MANKRTSFEVGKPLTIEQAKRLRRGMVVYCRETMNPDGTPTAWCVNGQPKTWKRNPYRIQVPLKRGVFHPKFGAVKHYSSITDTNIHLFTTEEML